jgi:predicted PurR-regulated permease PerM
MKAANIAYTLVIAIGIGFILIIGKSIILPLVLAFVIWFIIKAVRDLIAGLSIAKKNLPKWLQNVLVLVVIFGILGIIGKLLTANIMKMAEAIPAYEANVAALSAHIDQRFNIDINTILKDYAGGLDLTEILRRLLSSLSDLLGKAFIIIIYVIFLLIEERAFPKKIQAIIKTKEKKESVGDFMEKIDSSINNYILIKTFVSLITGTLSYIILLLLGIDFAFFWAFLIFLLNYIPTIGSMIATLFPALAAIFQFGELMPALWVLLGVGSVQVVMGNIIEPKLMGSNLNISILVVVLMLILWGSIWGITGMILCIPITVVLIRIFALFDKTRWIAIMLSGNGKVD